MYIEELYSPHGRNFFPFRLRLDEALPACHVIGGMPPRGVTPRFRAETTRYFGTCRLTIDTEVSMFYHFDYERERSPLYFFTASYRLWDESARYVEFVVHQLRQSAEGSPASGSPLPQLRFNFLAPGEDPSDLTPSAYINDKIYPDHKIGGLPYFEQLEGTALDDTARARVDGYQHVLQLAFPGPDDSLIGADWPFGEMVFHVFAKRNEVNGQFAFRYGWG